MIVSDMGFFEPWRNDEANHGKFFKAIRKVRAGENLRGLRFDEVLCLDDCLSTRAASSAWYVAC